MTIRVDITEAEAKLSELVTRAEAGEEVIIVRDGKPAVTLTVAPQPDAPPKGKRKLGVWAHLNLDIPMSTFDPDPEIEAWVNKSIFPDE